MATPTGYASGLVLDGLLPVGVWEEREKVHRERERERKKDRQAERKKKRQTVKEI